MATEQGDTYMSLKPTKREPTTDFYTNMCVIRLILRLMYRFLGVFTSTALVRPKIPETNYK